MSSIAERVMEFAGRTLSGRPASRRRYHWAPQVEVVESRCLLSGTGAAVVGSTETAPLTNPNDVFTSTGPSDLGDMLAEEQARIDNLFEAIPNPLTPPEANPPLESPEVLTVDDLINKADELSVDGLPFTTGVPVLVIPIDGPIVDGIIVTGEGQVVLTNGGVFETEVTTSIGVIGTEIDVNVPFLPEGTTLTIVGSCTITDSTDGDMETGLNITIIFRR